MSSCKQSYGTKQVVDIKGRIDADTEETNRMVEAGFGKVAITNAETTGQFIQASQCALKSTILHDREDKMHPMPLLQTLRRVLKAQIQQYIQAQNETPTRSHTVTRTARDKDNDGWELSSLHERVLKEEERHAQTWYLLCESRPIRMAWGDIPADRIGHKRRTSWTGTDEGTLLIYR